MQTAEAQVETERPSRYLVQLCRHANEMGDHLGHRPRAHSGGPAPEIRHVEWSDTDGIVRMDWGQWTMHATTDTLTLRAEADDEENLRRIQELVARRLETIGRRDHLKVTWQRPPTPPGTTPVLHPKPAAHRRHLKTILFTTAAALAVAVHLGLGGAVLASWRWTSWVADLVLAIVLVKVALVVIGLRRHAVHRRYV